MAANLFRAGEGRARPEGGGGEEGRNESVRAEFLCPREKGGVYRQGRIIGDSLFLLASPPPRDPSFNSLDPIYRLCSIDCPKLWTLPFFVADRSFVFEPRTHLALDPSAYRGFRNISQWDSLQSRSYFPILFNDGSSTLSHRRYFSVFFFLQNRKLNQTLLSFPSQMSASRFFFLGDYLLCMRILFFLQKILIEIFIIINYSINYEFT